jgi:hypothetical protein
MIFSNGSTDSGNGDSSVTTIEFSAPPPNYNDLEKTLVTVIASIDEDKDLPTYAQVTHLDHMKK